MSNLDDWLSTMYARNVNWTTPRQVFKSTILLLWLVPLDLLLGMTLSVICFVQKKICRCSAPCATHKKLNQNEVHEIKLKVKELNEDTGEVEVVGSLNATEVNFLVQFAINYLMAAGAEFHLDQPDEEKSRITMPEGATLQ